MMISPVTRISFGDGSKNRRIARKSCFRFYIFRSPLFTFDLNSQSGDVAWAPYSRSHFLC